MKWLGIIAGLILFGGAVYILAGSAGELRARRQQVQQNIASAQVQWQAGDYSTAWDTLARAEKTAAADGVTAKLLGGLSNEQQAIRAREQDLAMEWVRSGRVPPGEDFSSVSQKLIDVLASGAASTLGSRSADLHAHLGWAYFLEQRDGNRNLELKPDAEYVQAVALDPTNPYGNAFWAHYILWSDGTLAAAQAKFAAALTTARARPDVRTLQMAAYRNLTNDAGDAAYLSVLNDMRKDGENIDLAAVEEAADKYSIAFHDPAFQQAIDAALTGAEQSDLVQKLVMTDGLDAPRRIELEVARAGALERADLRAPALAAWTELQIQLRSEPHSVFTQPADDAIKRLQAK